MTPRPWRWIRAAGIVLGFGVVGIWLWGAGSLLIVPAFALVVSVWAIATMFVGARWLTLEVIAPAWTVGRRLASLSWDAIAADPDGARIHRFAARVDRRLKRARPLGTWVANRLRPGRGGLFRTTTALIAGAGALGLWRLSRLISAPGAVVQLDRRIADVAAHLSDTTEQALMLALTTAGRTPFMATATALLAAGALVAGARRAAILVVAITAGSALAVTVLKAVMSRVRPGLGLLVESSSSWPSGHASAGLALALAVVVAWRSSGRATWPRIAVGTVPVGLLIGYSRAYLEIHWATDVVGGWLVAITVVAIVLFVDDVVLPAPTSAPVRHRWLTAAALGAAAVLVAAGLAGRTTRLPTVEPEPPRALATNDPADVAGLVPIFSETLTGRPMEPIGLIVAGTGEQIEAALEEAGWSVAAQPSVRNLLRAYWNGIRRQGDPSAPVTPAFLDAQVHDLAFELSIEGVRQRHHARFWQLAFETAQGCPIWFATASFDDAVEWTWRTVLPNHHIAPAIDEEQAFVADGLATSGMFTVLDRVSVTKPTMGTNAAGDPWFTDGMATVLGSTHLC